MKVRGSFGFLFASLGLLLSGCLTSNALQYSSAAEINQYHLARVRKGMSQKEVLQIMHRPYSYETFEFDDEVYDVWFYVTRPTGLGQTRMVPQNLTPLTFKNGYLVSTGYQYYYYVVKEEAKKTETKAPPKPEKKTQEAEDKEFEKALKGTKEKSSKEPTPKKKEKLPPNVRIISQEDSIEEEEETQEPSYDQEEDRMEEEDSEQNFNFW